MLWYKPLVHPRVNNCKHKDKESVGKSGFTRRVQVSFPACETPAFDVGVFVEVFKLL